MKAFKMNSWEDESRFKTETVTRSIAKTTIRLVIMILAAAPSFAQLASVPDSYLGIWMRIPVMSIRDPE